MSTQNWNQLIEKTSHWDKDERYMATNDLCNLLTKDVKIDEHTEQKVCTAVLKQLDDASNDVQSVAVKCLGVLLKKVHEAQIKEISLKLSALVVDSSKDALRDIYSIGLKTLISDVPASMGASIAPTLAAKLLVGVQQTVNDDVKRESLDNLSDLLRRFGQHLESSHSGIMAALVSQLKHDKQVIRKRAAQALGNLAVVSNDALLNDLVHVLLTRINELEASGKGNGQESRTLIQSIGTISRTVGFRLGKHLPQIIPLFIRFCGSPDDEETHNDAANELRESCFPGLESFVLRCPKEVSAFLQEILRVSLAFMKYDPNYSYGEDEGDEMDVDEDEEAYDEEDYGGGSDDDDTSWKVRKAAVKVIVAIATSHPTLLREVLPAAMNDLISRFKEREENVRLDIIACFTKFIDVAQESLSHAVVVEEFAPRVDQIVAASCVQLGVSSIKTKEVVVAMLKSLVTALKGGLDRHLLKLAAILDKLLVDPKNQSLRLHLLVLIRVILQNHSSKELLPVVEKLLPTVVKVANEDWYKTMAETLRVLSAVVVVVRPYEGNQTYSNEFAFQPFVAPIFSVVLKRLSLLDVDVEIKETAISAMGVTLTHFADSLSSAEHAQSLSLFQQRLENETTRVATLKAITLLATRCAAVSLSQWTEDTAKTLILFTKHSSRVLRQLTLQTLNALIAHVSVSLSVESTALFVQEVSLLLTTEDVSLLNATLTLLNTFIEKNTFNERVLYAVHTYAYKSLISLARHVTGATSHNAVLQHLCVLFQTLQATNSPFFTFDLLFDALYVESSRVLSNKQALGGLAKCVAALFARRERDVAREAMQRFARDLQDRVSADITASATPTSSGVSAREREQRELETQLALHCMGELGEHTDLSSLPLLQDTLRATFEDPCEDVKYAAACALGRIAAGSAATFLPLILQSLTERTTTQTQRTREVYLLFVALRETLAVVVREQEDLEKREEDMEKHGGHLEKRDSSQEKHETFAAYFPSILPVLLEVNTSSSTEESVRNLLAECLGLLTILDIDHVLPVLHVMLTARGERLGVRTATHALRAAVARTHLSKAVLASFSQEIVHFLVLLSEEEDLEVKRAALQLVNTAAHHHAELVHVHIAQSVFPELMKTLTIKKERTVDLGPFKHKVDDNLPLRKLCLTMLNTILEHMPDTFDASAVMEVALALLGDHDDVKVAFVQLLPRIATHNENAVAVKLDQLVPLLDAAIAKAGKDVEKGGRDVLQSIVKTIVQLQRMASLTVVSRLWSSFVDSIKSSPLTANIFSQVEGESKDLH